MRHVLLMTCLAGAAACSEGGVSANDATPDDFALTQSELRIIANEFAIKKGMTLLCEGDDVDYLTPFMEDLRQAGAPKELREQIAADSVEMMNKISTEEPEYICTPEMFESAAERVSAAQAKWDEMRGITE